MDDDRTQSDKRTIEVLGADRGRLEWTVAGHAVGAAAGQRAVDDGAALEELGESTARGGLYVGGLQSTNSSEHKGGG